MEIVYKQYLYLSLLIRCVQIAVAMCNDNVETGVPRISKLKESKIWYLNSNVKYFEFNVLFFYFFENIMFLCYRYCYQYRYTAILRYRYQYRYRLASNLKYQYRNRYRLTSKYRYRYQLKFWYQYISS